MIKGLKFWYDNWLETHFQSTTVQFFWLSLATIIYISAAETIFFVLSQITIIQTLRQGSKVPLSPWHVVKIVLRSLCYIAAVFMQFVTLGGYFFPSSSGRVSFDLSLPNTKLKSLRVSAETSLSCVSDQSIFSSSPRKLHCSSETFSNQHFRVPSAQPNDPDTPFRQRSHPGDCGTLLHGQIHTGFTLSRASPGEISGYKQRGLC
ncbi:hypothetical protein DFJ73DRAFT_187981 [Zopfochytrium polystomum]|nr:hypothetical protein DFJ73DRAFT_187981 [Zopfochytrium polystomum]